MSHDGNLCASVAGDNSIKVISGVLHNQLEGLVLNQTSLFYFPSMPFGQLLAKIEFVSAFMLQVYDVVNFDMTVMLRITFVPATAEWIFKVCTSPLTSAP